MPYAEIGPARRRVVARPLTHTIGVFLLGLICGGLASGLLAFSVAKDFVRGACQ